MAKTNIKPNQTVAISKLPADKLQESNTQEPPDVPSGSGECSDLTAQVRNELPPPPAQPPTPAAAAGAPGPKRGFSESVRATLLAAGVALPDIAAAELAPVRRSLAIRSKINNPALLAKFIPEMLAEKPGRPLWAAGAYGRWLVSHGHHAPVKGNQAWGDAGGIKGLDLVKITIGGRKFYDLRTAAGMTTDAKAARQAELEALPAAALRLLIVNVGD